MADEVKAAAPVVNEEVLEKPEQVAEKVEECNTEKQNGSTDNVTDSTETQKEEVKEAPQNGTVKSDPAIDASVVKQIEYYFGDFNLPRDKFLSAEVKKDEGWVPLATMLKFARLLKLTKDPNVVATAIKESKTTIMEIDESSTKIRRSLKHPLPDLSEDFREEAIKRTIYCKGFPKDGSCALDDLLEFFKQFGDYDSVKMRNYLDKNSEVQGFKGSVLVVFKSVELAKAFMESPPMQYQKVYLIRKWFADYLEEKKQEIEERKAKKQAKLESSENANDKKAFEELPKGIYLKAQGFTADTMREDIKSAVVNLTNDCAFIDFKKGEKEAYIRFNEANSNKIMLEALQGNLKVKDTDISLQLVEGEEEEKQLQLANDARRKAHSAGPYQKKRKMGGGGGYRGRNKRQRHN